MDWDQVLKYGKDFVVDGVQCYDMLIGPRNRRAIVIAPGVLHERYGFTWYYNPESLIREAAAKTLLSQYVHSLMDHRAVLLKLGRLGKSGEDTKARAGSEILYNVANRGCSDREYAEMAEASTA